MAYFDWHEEPGYWRDVTRHFAPQTRLLDLGCGNAWLASHFPDYIGLDASPEAVERAAERGVDVQPWEAADPVPLPDASVDGVVMKDLLEHVPDAVHVVREALRVLRPGGRAFATSPDAQRWVWDDYTHRRPFTARAFRMLFADQGFEVERVGHESVMPGIGIVSARTGRNRRPPVLAALAALPIVRRNVLVVANKPR